MVARTRLLWIKVKEVVVYLHCAECKGFCLTTFI